MRRDGPPGQERLLVVLGSVQEAIGRLVDPATELLAIGRLPMARPLPVPATRRGASAWQAPARLWTSTTARSQWSIGKAKGAPSRCGCHGRGAAAPTRGDGHRRAMRTLRHTVDCGSEAWHSVY